MTRLFARAVFACAIAPCIPAAAAAPPARLVPGAQVYVLAAGQPATGWALPAAATSPRDVAAGDEVFTGPAGSAVIELADGARHRLLPDTRVRLATGKAPELLSGERIVLPKDTTLPGTASPETLVSLRREPEFPAAGTSASLLVDSTVAITDMSLELPGQANVRFQPEPADGARHRQRARYGLDCLDRRDEQPYRVTVKLAGGATWETRRSVLLYPARTRVRGFLGEYSRVAAPGDFLHARWGARWATKAALPAFPAAGTLVAGTERWSAPVKPARPNFPAFYWTPTVNLPADKLALYRDAEGLKRENGIHWQATAWSEARQLWTGAFVWPALATFSSIFAEIRTYNGGWSSAHYGVDIASRLMVPVRAPNAARVAFAGPTTMCGNNVILDHGRHVFSKIMHMHQLAVKTGEYVKKGQVLGWCGSTGLSTGPHIHWELLVGLTRVDPGQWVIAAGERELSGLDDGAARGLGANW